MEMREVESSNLTRIGYDEATGQLVVEFRGGGRYGVAEVTPQEFRDLMAAPSKGAFYAKHFGRNTDRKVTKLPQQPAPNG